MRRQEELGLAFSILPPYIDHQEELGLDLALERNLDLGMYLYDMLA